VATRSSGRHDGGRFCLTGLAEHESWPASSRSTACRCTSRRLRDKTDRSR
jgi:hypothetical protein